VQTRSANEGIGHAAMPMAEDQIEVVRDFLLE